MTATSEQIAMHQKKDMKDTIASIASFSNSNISGTKRSSSIQSPARSIKSERRPSFSIALPSSTSKSSFLNGRSITISDEAGQSSNTAALGYRTARRPSVHFSPLGEDDSLLNHEAKNGLPKTPYPTTGEEQERIQTSLFKQ